MPYNLRARKNRRSKPEPPSESDDTSDTDYMVPESEEDEVMAQKRWTSMKSKKSKTKSKPNTKEPVKNEAKKKRRKRKLERKKEDTDTEMDSDKEEPKTRGKKTPLSEEIKTRESPLDIVIKKLITEHAGKPQNEVHITPKSSKNPFFELMNGPSVKMSGFIVGDDEEEDEDYDPEEDEEDEDSYGFNFASLLGKKKDPYEVRLPASQLTPELLTYLQCMPKLLGSDKKIGDDIKDFKNLKKKDQKDIATSVKSMISSTNMQRDEHPYFKILKLPIDEESKRAAIDKQKQVFDSENSPMSDGNTKLKNWVRGFLNIPFGVYSKMPKSSRKSPSEYLKKASQILDKEVYGLDDAKDHILRYVAHTITNPSAAGNCLAFLGPPGTGKTSLIKDALGKILNRPVSMIALGGNTDSSFLEGHSYTYEGSLWGQVIDILMRSKCMNPVIIFDELDKVSKTQRGDEIIGILTHMTDSTQNKKFQDKYFAGINIDLSKVLFVFTLNDQEKVNSVLLDRLRVIRTNGYSRKEKKTIGQDYLLPRISREYKIKNISLSTSSWEYILNERKEPGVRNLKRDLETIISRLNIHSLIKDSRETIRGVPKDIKWTEGELSEEDTKTLLGNRDDGRDKPPMGMYA